MASDPFRGWRCRRKPMACALVVLGMLVTQAVGVIAAEASTVLCSSSNFGYGCVSSSGYQGQSTWGYPVDWRGHNCTN